MIPESKGPIFHVCIKKHNFGATKHEKAAFARRVSNVFKIAKAQNA